MHRARFSAFRSRLLGAVGLAALTAPVVHGACGGSVHFSDDDGVVDPSGPGSGTTTGGTSGQGTTTGGTTTGGQGGYGAAGPGQGGNGAAGGAGQTIYTCFPETETGCPELAEAGNVFGYCTFEDFYYIEEWVSGPIVQEGECCYEVIAPYYCGEGRPLVVDDDVKSAALVDGERGWAAVLEGSCDATLDAAPALAAAWERSALFEHASVASFARVALELMAAGAPAHLVAQSHEAALDEIRHAELCFALANRFRGAPRGPGKLDLGDSLPLRRDLVALAVSTVREGCIGETIAALIAEEQHDRATDPEVRRALAIIAADEARHAELAWKTVAWAIGHGGDAVRSAVARTFAEAAQHLPRLEAHVDDGLEAYGVLSARRVGEVVARALAEVVLPLGHTLTAPKNDAQLSSAPLTE
jgi:hypothetical protein